MQSWWSQGDMSKSTSGKVTLLEIFELKLKSCLNLLRWMHRVSGKSVTREYFKPLRSFLPASIHKISMENYPGTPRKSRSHNDHQTIAWKVRQVKIGKHTKKYFLQCLMLSKYFLYGLVASVGFALQILAVHSSRVKWFNAGKRMVSV